MVIPGRRGTEPLGRRFFWSLPHIEYHLRIETGTSGHLRDCSYIADTTRSSSHLGTQVGDLIRQDENLWGANARRWDHDSRENP